VLSACDSAPGTTGDAVEITYAPGVASDGVANEASIEAAVKSPKEPTPSSSSLGPMTYGRAKATTERPWSSPAIRTSW